MKKSLEFTFLATLYICICYWNWLRFDDVANSSQNVQSKKLHILILCSSQSQSLLCTSNQDRRQRIDFKIAVLVCTSLHGLTPPYLSEDCQLVTDMGLRHLRSADVHTCAVPRTQTRLGDRSFAIAGPRLWNKLPVDLRQRDICLSQFRRLLKTFLPRDARSASAVLLS